jgi:uncharacterized protein
MRHLKIKVQPRSPRTEWAGTLSDGTLKVRLAAVPDKGKANAELIRFLAAEFHVARADVEIVAGQTSTLKQIRLRK